MAKASRFSHAVLSSYNKDAMVKWYTEALGGEVVWDLPFFSILTFDEEHHRIGVMQLQGEPQEKSPLGLNHLAFAFDNVPELLGHYKMLKAAGNAPLFCTNHGITWSLYFNDPDGNTVEFFVDLMSPAEATEFMTKPEFMANPGGVPFDPDELLAKLEADAPLEEIIFFDGERNLRDGAALREAQLAAAKGE